MRYKTSVNGQDFQISLFSTHTLDDNSQKEINLPLVIDSHFISNILFSFSGTLDQSIPIPPTDMLRSSAVQSFIRYLKIKAGHLGILHISEAFLDNYTSGVPKVSVALSRYASVRVSPCTHMLSIHLAYNWKSFSQLSSNDITIFSPQMLLPLQPVLNQLVQKLFSVHIVGTPVVSFTCSIAVSDSGPVGRSRTSQP
ncbi:hypothetical protein B0F90DRAFT_1247200 [Multifurca ochricompacta]|uniref:Uncharacterized protein n=1 Tax=Multifurca ochricompacta TaxID=376703 RepID=A0AAD4M9F0_9AGAM|nr:hypothetical protein B0F90DRAFT_1247200 [Multifurca ochricompacta]